MYYEDEFDRAQGVGKPTRPQILITKDQPRTDDPIGTFIDNELGRTQAPMPRPDPRGSRPTYEEGDTIPGSDSYGKTPLTGPEYRRPLLPPPDEQGIPITPRYNPELRSLTPPSVARVSENDLSYGPEGQSQLPIGSGQDASIGHTEPRGSDKSIREVVREGANWLKSKTGIGERSFVGDFVQGLQQNGEVIGKFLRGEISKEDPEFTKAIVGLTSDLGLGGISTAPLRTGSVGIFGGALGAKNFGTEAMSNLQKATAMHAEGASTVETFKSTGWFYDRGSNKFKMEIPDDVAKLLKEPSEISIQNSGIIKGGDKLSSVIEHPWLFKAYPELKDVKIGFNGKMDDAIAKFHHEGMIEVGPDWKTLNPEKRTAILLHEIQHYVQTKEEFYKDMIQDPKFKPPKEFEDNLQAAEKAVQKLMKEEKPDMTTLSSILNFIAESKNWLTQQEKTSFERYWNSPREKEARLVEQRFLAGKGQERDY